MKESPYLPPNDSREARYNTGFRTQTCVSRGLESSAVDMGFHSLALAAVPLSFLCHQFAHPFAAVRASLTRRT